MGWTGSAPNKTFTRTDGTFTGAAVYGQEKAAGIGIVETNLDATEYDIAQGLNAALLKDGGNKPTAVIDAGGYGFSNLATLASATEVSVASSATTPLLASSALFNVITGTTTITSLGSGINQVKIARFTGALTLTHNATSLILPGGANITTTAGDTMIVVSDGSSNARVLAYQPAATSLATVAQNKILGRISAGTGVAEPLTGTQATTLLDPVVGDSGSGGTKGLVPAAASGDAAAGKFLKADGTFAVPIIATLVPQGRLTATTGTPVIAADASAVTSIFYTPYVGNFLPIYNGSVFILLAFFELTLTLVANHVANTLYDVFAFSNSGVATIATGPAWTNPGNYVSAGTLTTGTASRGTGAGTTQLARTNGLWTNAVAMTVRNGSSTYSVAASQGTYLGTIWIDAAAGQLTCHVSYGQNRKFGVWNTYNRVPIVLTGGVGTASWTYNTATFRAANNTAANCINLLTGLAEEWFDTEYKILVNANTGGQTPLNGVGWNSTTGQSGVQGQLALTVLSGAINGGHVFGSYLAAPAIGLNAVVGLEKGGGSSNTVWSGTSANMQVRGIWRG